MVSLNCKNVQHVKICLPCNFEVNPITHCGLLPFFSSNIQNFNTLRPLFQKLYEIDVKFKLQTCSACQDLPTLQFLAHLYELLPSFGVRRPSVNFLKNLLLKPLGQFKPNLA
jgi:hypothetical protein